MPAGLTAVAVFPPFETPRTFPAEAVIFAENPQIERRNKRSLASKFQDFLQNAKCLRTRLYARSHPEAIAKLRRISSDPDLSFFNRKSGEVNSIDDCIEGIGEPLYGFVVNVTVAQDSPCILGQTCRNVPEERQTGEDFQSLGPPDCRVRFDRQASGC